MTGASSLVRNPIETAEMPYFSAGAIFSPSCISCVRTPSMIGTLGP